MDTSIFVCILNVFLLILLYKERKENTTYLIGNPQLDRVD